MQGTYKNDQKHGKWQEFSELGNPLESGKYEFNRKCGEWIFYDKRGRVFRKQGFYDDFMHGKWVEYHPNGQKHSEGAYKMLTKTGTWTYYTEKGEILYQIQYKNGVKKVLKDVSIPTPKGK
jgi:antitoxin component YwqK of YwqJK toxin-antitoxin module